MKAASRIVCAAAAMAGISACTAPDAVSLQPKRDLSPECQTVKLEQRSYVPFDAATTVTLECPDPAAAKWLEKHFGEWFGDAAPKVSPGRTGLAVRESPEAYAASVDSNGVKIAANTLAGTRWASYTLRQLAIDKRGTFKTEGRLLPRLSISDRPHLAFRAVHLCCFPETRIQQIERAIRLAALLKFNYAIVEPWGMYKSEKHPWWPWPDAYLTKSEVRRLVAVGRDLGITLVPMINCYGHASSSRGNTIKHSALDFHPEYGPLFEPEASGELGADGGDGWCWCISNPETQRVLRELIAEMHEDFGNPPFFHIGCDEAFGAQTCPECAKTPKTELALKHFNGLSDFLKARGARAMMWHDMLLDKSDPRWEGFIKFGGKDAPAILDGLSKDIVICDWQYYDKVKGKNGVEWPTMAHFAQKGFSVAGCPWMNYKAMVSMGEYLAKNGGFGFIQTTWHTLSGTSWEKMYKLGSNAAWGSPVSHGVSFQRSLRLVGHDMKITDYRDTGYRNFQVAPAK